MSEQLYSAEEAAQILGLQVRTVRNYVRDGRLPGVRIGKQYRIARSALEAFAGAGVGAGGTTTPNATASQTIGAVVAPPPVPAQVSSIVELADVGPDRAGMIERTLAAATLTREENLRTMRVEPLYDERRSRLRIIIVGSAAETAELLRVIDALTGEGG
jgi:excisionase family DNA binding protein